MSLRYATAGSPDDPQGQSLKKLADEVKQNSGGKVTIKLYFNSSLFDQNGQETAIQNGTLDMTDVTPAFITDQYKPLSILTVPYLIKSPEALTTVLASPDGQTLIKGAEKAIGVKILAPTYLGTRTLDMRKPKKKIMTPQDLNGVKLRIPNAQSWVDMAKSLGASPTPIAFGDLYSALQTGTVDGQDNPVITDQVQHFNEVTDTIVLTNHLVDLTMYGINQKSWDKLSPSEQAVLSAAAADASAFDQKTVTGKEQSVLDAFKKAGMNIYTPNIPAFRDYAWNYYATQTSYPKDWPAGMFDSLKKLAQQ